MEELLSKKICELCYEGTDSDEKEVIQYGIQLVVETVVKMFVLLLFATSVGKFWECIQFYMVFCPIRAMAGGIHCKTNMGCTATFLGIFLCGILFNDLLIPQWLVVIAFLLCLLVLLIWAPSSTENNPITNQKIRLSKKITSIILLIIWFLEIKYSIFHFQKGYIFATVVSVVVLVLVQEVLLWKKA